MSEVTELMTFVVVGATGLRLEVNVSQIVAEAADGSFCLLPRHRDFVTSIVAGLVDYVIEDGTEQYLAADEGILTKTDRTVVLCTRHAVACRRLDEIERVMTEEFAVLDDRERAARAAVARLEADFAKQFLLLREDRHV